MAFISHSLVFTQPITNRIHELFSNGEKNTPYIINDEATVMVIARLPIKFRDGVVCWLCDFYHYVLIGISL